MYDDNVPQVNSKSLDTKPDCLIIIQKNEIIRAHISNKCNKRKVKNLLYKIIDAINKEINT